jgi:hypothetical protein
MTTYTDVTPLPSGRYGSRIVEHDTPRGDGPVVQVVQRIAGEWHGTPARHYAATILGTADVSRLAIDYGQGWALDEADTAAHRAYAERAVSASGTVVDSPTPDPDHGSITPTPQEAAVSTTVQIPATVTAFRTNGYGAAPVEPTAATALTAARANQAVRSLTPEQRATFKALGQHREVDVVALTDAIVAALGASATRLGQSMARRYQRDLLLGAWGWLQAGAPVPTVPTWTTGATVTLSLVDGALVVDLDLSEITDRHAAEEADDDALAAFEAADKITAAAGHSARIVLGAL